MNICNLIDDRLSNPNISDRVGIWWQNQAEWYQMSPEQNFSNSKKNFLTKYLIDKTYNLVSLDFNSV